MEQIKEVLRPTGKQCSCRDNGTVVEIFTKKYGKSNGVMGPGHYTPSFIESIGFGCNKCGLTYGLPVFRNLDLESNQDIKREIEFELSLSTVTLVRRIMLKDLPLVQTVKKGSLSIGNSRTKIIPLGKATTKPKSIPPELKKLPVGTTVYCPPKSDSLWLTPKEFFRVQLSVERNAQVFEVHRSCFE
jgi:hypothetical protein